MSSLMAITEIQHKFEFYYLSDYSVSAVQMFAGSFFNKILHERILIKKNVFM